MPRLRAAAIDELVFHQWPAIASKRVKAFVRVAGRRWDVHLDNGVIVIKLARREYCRCARAGSIGEFDEEQQVLSRDIALIDMRLS